MTARRSKRPTRTGAKRPEAPDAKPKRSKATFDLPGELIAELRVASVMSSETLAAIAERALLDELERLRTELNAGKRFPMPADPKARRGRPPKS